MKTRLTIKRLDALKPAKAGKPYYQIRDSVVDHPDILCQLLIRVGGKRDSRPPMRTWVIYCRLPTAQKTHRKIGHYPQLSLTEARARAGEIATDLRQGRDPFSANRIAREGERFRFEVAASKYHDWEAADGKVPGVPRYVSWRSRKRLIATNVMPHWAARDVRTITTDDVLDILEPIRSRAPTVAEQVRGILSKMWDRFIIDRLAASNPAKPIPMVHIAGERDDFCDPDDLARLWPVIVADLEGDHPQRAVWASAMLCVLLSANRRAEVLQSRVSDISQCRMWLEVDGHRFDEGRRFGGTKQARYRDSYFGTPFGQWYFRRHEAIRKRLGLDDVEWLFPSLKTRRWVRDFASVEWTRYQRLTGIRKLRWHMLGRHTPGTLLEEELGLDDYDIGRLLDHQARKKRQVRVARVTQRYIHGSRQARRKALIPLYERWHFYLSSLFGFDSGSGEPTCGALPAPPAGL